MCVRAYVRVCVCVGSIWRTSVRQKFLVGFLNYTGSPGYSSEDGLRSSG